MRSDAGNVARLGVGANSEPMMPPSSTNRKLPDMHNAWVADSIQTCGLRGIVHWSPARIRRM